MEIESKNYNIVILIYSKIENKKFNTNILLLSFFIQIQENEMWNSFLIVFIFNFINWLMVNDYWTVFSQQAFIAKYLYVTDFILDGLLIIQKQPTVVLGKKIFKNLAKLVKLLRKAILKNICERLLLIIILYA